MFNIPEKHLKKIKERFENPEEYVRVYIKRDSIFLVYREIYLDDLRVEEQGYVYSRKDPYLSAYRNRVVSPKDLILDQKQIFIKKYLGIDVIDAEEIEETFEKLVWLYVSLKTIEKEIEGKIDK